MKKIIYILLLVPLFAAGCAQTRSGTEEKFLLDTMVAVTIDGRPLESPGVRKSLDAAFTRAEEVEKHLDIHHRNSDTEKLNRTRSVRASKELWEALRAGNEVYESTGGAFDMTIGPVTSLWRFDKPRRVPSGRELADAVKLVDGTRLVMGSQGDRRPRLEGSDARLDLGGVAKGVAIDQMARTLAERGLENSLINAISSIKAVGPKTNGAPWRVGIESPRPETTPGLLGVIELKKGAVSTSGDYQRVMTVNGRRYHHILDPKTGRPATGFMSVTAVTENSAAYADALSTGLAVMGRKKAMELVERTPGVEAVFVDSDGQVWISPGLRDRVSKLKTQVD